MKTAQISQEVMDMVRRKARERTYEVKKKTLILGSVAQIPSQHLCPGCATLLEVVSTEQIPRDLRIGTAPESEAPKISG